MPTEISWETRERAEELYITGGLNYDQVADATGVSVTQLQRWGKAGDWFERKREYREQIASIRRDTVKLRAELLKKAIRSKQPQDVYAFARIEQVAQLAASRAAKSAAENPLPAESPGPIEINAPGEAVDALMEVVERRLNAMLTRPGELKLSAVKDLKSTLELVEKLKEKYRPEDKAGGQKGLSDELVEEINSKILGVKRK